MEFAAEKVGAHLKHMRDVFELIAEHPQLEESAWPTVPLRHTYPDQNLIVQRCTRTAGVVLGLLFRFQRLVAAPFFHFVRYKVFKSCPEISFEVADLIRLFPALARHRGGGLAHQLHSRRAIVELRMNEALGLWP